MVELTAPTRDHETAFYDRRWAALAAEPLASARLKRSAAILQEIADLALPAPDIIEIGSGAGHLAGLLQVIGRTTAVELSESAVRSAQLRFPHATFLAGDLYELDLPRGAFDLAVSQEVIEHVDDQDRFFRVLRSLLRPGGYAIVTTPNANAFRRAGRLEKYLNGPTVQPRENLLTISELKRLARPYFTIHRVSTVVPAGHRGLLRLVNSPVLNRNVVWRALRAALPVGLHTVLVGRAIPGTDH